MAELAIDANGLTKHFDDFVAVDGITFQVEPQAVVGYLGPNGSGKTTTIRMLLGLLLPTAGRAQVLGWDVVNEAEALRRQVGYMSQKFALYDELTVWENLSFYAGVYGSNDRRQLQRTLDRLGLAGKERKQAQDLPTGFRQRLALAAAIVHQPRLLFLDEPTSGVDPNARRAFWDLIYELAEGGITIFATTHYMDEAEYCQRVGIMRAGRLLAFDAPTRLKQSALNGLTWDVTTPDLLAGLSTLEKAPEVRRVSLAGDHLRVITGKAASAEKLAMALTAGGIQGARVEATEPGLEDVFLALAAD